MTVPEATPVFVPALSPWLMGALVDVLWAGALDMEELPPPSPIDG